MSSECDEIYSSLLLNRLPKAWAKICYPSHKPLASWYDDLQKRIDFIRNWLTEGHPHAFWISGLFFPQGFVTGVQQFYARETKIAISDVTFKHTVLNKFSENITSAPTYGVYIYGLYLEAASWDMESGLLIDQKVGEMFYKMPVIWLETTKEKKEEEELEGDDENEIYQYKCPVFKTKKRTGIISSSGRSDNHVINIVIIF
jgi:dynein heavy chain